MGWEGGKRAFQRQGAAWLSGRKEHSIWESEPDFSPQFSWRVGKVRPPPPPPMGAASGQDYGKKPGRRGWEGWGGRGCEDACGLQM